MSNSVSRRDFLQISALSLGAVGLPRSASPATTPVVALVVKPGDGPARVPSARWALDELRSVLASRGVSVRVVESLAEAADADLCILVADAEADGVASILAKTGLSLPVGPESLAIATTPNGGRPLLVVCGRDARGLMYGVLELSERARYGADPIRALTAEKPVAEQAFNPVRAIGRPFVSDVEDKAWFYDRSFWPAYFGMLAKQRFNRFHLCLGMGYDTLRWVEDSYLLFAYPFLVSVPGYDVRAVNLADAERDRNLEALRFISDEAAAHGIDFQLGLWTHGYQWADSPKANYTIEGLTPANQAAYSRDALAAVLRACPAIAGVTLRTHYESGVREGSYAFWRTIFEGVVRSGRTLEIELHAKGLDRRMIDGALSLGVPVRVSAKYWAEHQGLPYHQAAIRELELPHADVRDSFSALSFGSRNHTRYGYADFMEEGRPYGVMFRVFPGTHKFLLWGDPLTAAAHARAFRFAGSDGAELFEPLAFKGRRGSGQPGSRCAYLDPASNPTRDWEKYLYTYLVWGRLLYNPEAAPETWHRLLRREYDSAAPAVEAALGSATRILPIVTTVHLPSAAHDTYSPEFYTNQSIPDPAAPCPYGDTPSPKVFDTVSPLDPELFSSIDEFAQELLEGERSAKYSPIEAAQWIEDLADAAAAKIAEAERLGKDASRKSPALQRAATDIRMQIAVGRFFAAKFRAGALYSIHEKSGDRRALEEALRMYRQARDAWARAAEEAKTVYRADITFGPLPHQRGHWLDRLPAMDIDIAALEKKLAATAASGASPSGRPAGALGTERVSAAIAAILAHPRRPTPRCRHTAPASFVRGTPLDLALSVDEPASPSVVRLHYRHVNQAERYQLAEMMARDGVFRATIPADYTDSPFPLQYYVELRHGAEGRWLFPGLGPDLANQPYVVVRQKVGS